VISLAIKAGLPKLRIRQTFTFDKFAVLFGTRSKPAKSLNTGFRIPNIISSAKKAGSLKSFASEVFAFVQRFKPWNT